MAVQETVIKECSGLCFFSKCSCIVEKMNAPVKFVLKNEKSSTPVWLGEKFILQSLVTITYLDAHDDTPTEASLKLCVTLVAFLLRQATLAVMKTHCWNDWPVQYCTVYLEEASDDSIQDVPLSFPTHTYRSNQVLLAFCSLRSWHMN